MVETLQPMESTVPVFAPEYGWHFGKICSEFHQKSNLTSALSESRRIGIDVTLTYFQSAYKNISSPMKIPTTIYEDTK